MGKQQQVFQAGRQEEKKWEVCERKASSLK
jgi:hypothetical protein